MSAGRRLARWLAIALIVAGVLLIADVALTLIWKEPVGALRARVDRDDRRTELDALFAVPLRTGTAMTRPLELRGQAALARESAHSGRVVGELRVRRLRLREPLLYGNGDKVLADGPAIYNGSPFPGEPGTVAVAGHRTTHGAEFRHVDELRRGDSISVRMPYATLRYRVTRVRVVAPKDVSVLRAREGGRQRIVLSACHPLFSAAKRIVVLADLRSSDAPR